MLPSGRSWTTMIPGTNFLAAKEKETRKAERASALSHRIAILCIFSPAHSVLKVLQFPFSVLLSCHPTFLVKSDLPSSPPAYLRNPDTHRLKTPEDATSNQVLRKMQAQLRSLQYPIFTGPCLHLDLCLPQRRGCL